MNRMRIAHYIPHLDAPTTTVVSRDEDVVAEAVESGKHANAVAWAVIEEVVADDMMAEEDGGAPYCDASDEGRVRLPEPLRPASWC